ncbi:nucleotidyltransferase domain-containing protein [Massilia sp. G4R7]|uniref:Nucleotidyltransferase domain-containing protein n=1 Tax=Massilia phyllostachyos TaxID=2898585 RepID=A0ABS8Q5B6_9BURK|nr:nucleotidyltransferase domain-containing protein [Massilia phyllostachyos]MCD2516940.1 nucleotidyltransferase domain-containing protein [Massilia phyllostachyos]
MKLPHRVSLADALFTKTTKAVIARLFTRPEQSWHLRELARAANVSPTMLSKEITTLAMAGIVLDERDGNRRRVRANSDCPIFDELKGIARKTAGLADTIQEALSQIAGIECAFIFGSVARGEERPGSDVDVCVIGSARNREVMSAMAAIEETVGRPVSCIVYTSDEIRKKIVDENAFVSRMLAAEKIFVIGGKDELKRSTRQLAEQGTRLSL